MMHRHRFFERLRQLDDRDGAPIGIWRLGSIDIAGYVREDLVPSVAKTNEKIKIEMKNTNEK